VQCLGCHRINNYQLVSFTHTNNDDRIGPIMAQYGQFTVQQHYRPRRNTIPNVLCKKKTNMYVLHYGKFNDIYRVVYWMQRPRLLIDIQTSHADSTMRNRS
jgi:hypothetical protein